MYRYTNAGKAQSGGVSGHGRYSEAELRGLARASAPSRRRRCARWRAQRSSAIVYGSGSAAIRFETVRERRRRHRRSAPAAPLERHRCVSRLLRNAQHFPAPGPTPRCDPPPPARAALTGPYWGCFETIQSSSGAWVSVCWRLSGHELCRHRTRMQKVRSRSGRILI
jgi:hypothetical protein